MKHYMLIETRDPGPTPDADWAGVLAADLKRGGAAVTLLLADNGVFAARAGAEADGLHAALKAGCKVVADRYALRERGLRDAELVRGVTAVEIDAVVEAMEAGTAMMWR